MSLSLFAINTSPSKERILIMCDVDLLMCSVTNKTGRTEFSIVLGFYSGT